MGMFNKKQKGAGNINSDASTPLLTDEYAGSGTGATPAGQPKKSLALDLSGVEEPSADATPRNQPVAVSARHQTFTPRSTGNVSQDGHLAGLKTGDYETLVEVIEARDLKGRDIAGTSDPVCFVTVFDSKQHTKTFKKTTSCVWNRLFYFTNRNLEPEDLEVGKVNVSVFDANSFSRNTLIGSYEFDVIYIYNQPNHEFYHKWVALTDPSQPSIIQGYLKLSVTVLGPGDVQATHDPDADDEEGDGDDLDSMVLMPPTIKQEGHDLVFQIYRGENLPKLDMFGSVDAYVGVKFAGNPLIKTSTITNLNPEWNEELHVPVMLPVMSDRIDFFVYDYERAHSDELISSEVFSFKSIPNTDEDKMLLSVQPRWLNLYGGQIDGGGEGLKLLNTGRREGTCYRGRILYSMYHSKCEKPKIKVEKLKNVIQKPVEVSYVLRVDIYHISEVSSSGKYSVEVCVGPISVMTSSKDSENGRVGFYEALPEVEHVFPQDVGGVPDIFVYLVHKRRRIAYIRYKAEDFIKVAKESTNPYFGEFQEDCSIGHIDFPGLVLSRVTFGLKHDVERNPRTEVVRPHMTPFELRAHIYQAKQLQGGDADGASDPYLVMRASGSVAKTSTKKQTCAPQWYETLRAIVNLPSDGLYMPNAHFLVYDQDIGKDDFLGRFCVPLHGVGLHMPTEPTWYTIDVLSPQDPPGSEFGYVLMSLQLLPVDKESHASLAPLPKIQPDCVECTVDITTIGLRNLAKYNMMDIKLPHVEYDFGDGINRLETEPSNIPSGTTPNFLQCQTIKLMLPKNPKFFPAMTVRVYDDRLGSNPLIGIATVDLLAYLRIRHVSTPRGVDRLSLDASSEIQEESVEQSSTSILIDNPLTNTLKFAGKGLWNATKATANMTASVASGSAAILLGEDDGDEEEGKDMEEIPEYMQDRPVQDGELEAALSDPFDSFDLTRGNELTDSKEESGRWKGDIRIEHPMFSTIERKRVSKEELVKSRPFVVRVYLLRGINLAPKDGSGYSDPYPVLKLGKTVIKDSDATQKATLQPSFFKSYELKTTLPGASQLEISLYDWDQFGEDDLIGSTTVDLEDRWYNMDWRELPKKPLEYRPLMSPASSTSQGKIEMWVEILDPKEAKKNPAIDISPPPPMKCELRVILWRTRDVPPADPITNQSDLFLTGCVEGGEKQETDIHWRVKKGKGSFNWRMKFDVELPMKVPRFKIQSWDKDITSPSDFIGETSISLKKLFQKCLQTKKSQSLDPEKQWVTMRNPNEEGSMGQVEVSFQVMPADRAKNRPAGLGRDHPNTNPELPPPKRVKFVSSDNYSYNLWSWTKTFLQNPFRPDLMMKELLGPELCYKFYGIFICLCCCACCVFVPLFAGQIFTIVNTFK